MCDPLSRGKRFRYSQATVERVGKTLKQIGWRPRTWSSLWVIAFLTRGRMKRNKRIVVATGATAAIITVGCGLAFALGVKLPFSDDGNTIKGCYNPSSGGLVVLTPAKPTCSPGNVPIMWNVTGPKGDKGDKGDQGIRGFRESKVCRESRVSREFKVQRVTRAMRANRDRADLRTMPLGLRTTSRTPPSLLHRRRCPRGGTSSSRRHTCRTVYRRVTRTLAASCAQMAL